jgi:heat shock protein HslJ
MHRYTVIGFAALAIGGLGVVGGCAPSSNATPGQSPAALSIPLDTQWRLSALHGVAPIAGHEPTLSWEADGRIHGSASCNRYFGEWSGTPQELQLKAVGMTKMACFPDSVGQQETAFVRALQQVRRLRMEGAALVLDDKAGQTLLRWERASAN